MKNKKNTKRVPQNDSYKQVKNFRFLMDYSKCRRVYGAFS